MCNPSIKRLFGYDMKEVIDKTTDMLFAEQTTNAALFQEMHEALEGEGFHISTATGKKKNGQTINLEIITGKLKHGDGVVLLIRDVTLFKETESKHLRGKELLRLITENMDDFVTVLDTDGKRLYNSPSCKKIFGDDPGCIKNTDFFAEIYPDDRERIKNIFRNTVETGTGWRAEFRFLLENDEVRFIESQGSIIKDEQDKVANVIVVSRDVTDRKQAEALFQESEDRYRVLIECSNDGVAMIEGDYHIYVNQKFLDIFGYEKTEDVIGKPPSMMVHPDDRSTVMDYVRKRQRGESVPSKYEFKGVKKDGTILFIEVSVAQTIYQRRAVSLAYLRDVTERERLEEQLRTMSLTDELTALYNRRGFFTLAQQQIKLAERTKKSLLLFFADLDRMKQINDTLGHGEGDNALLETTAVLKETFRESDIIGRMGGDEFAALAIDTTDETGEVLMKRLHDVLEACNNLEERKYTLSLSVGTARYDPEAPSSLDELMARADMLMYEEKKRKQHNGHQNLHLVML